MSVPGENVVQQPYNLGDYLHFFQLYRRNQRRQRNWGRAFETAVRNGSFKLRPPYVITGPSQLRGKDYENWFTDYLNTFGNESCFMPFYWARIHAKW